MDVMAWVRGHLVAVISAAVGVVVLVVVVVVIVVASSGGGGGARIPPGSLVGNQPLTTGYRILGKLTHHTVDSLTVQITGIEAMSGEARNVLLRAGVTQEFERAADGTVALARNGHVVTSTASLHDGDTVTILGQFTTVSDPPAAPHDGYAYLAVEASSG